MLKFLYDEKKKNFFLSFWQIRDIEEFKELINDTIRFFSLYVEMEKKYHRIVGEILRDYFENKTLVIEEERFKFVENSSENTKIKNIFEIKDIKYLDAINIINIFQEENDILKRQNSYYLQFSDSFKHFLEQVLVITTNDQIVEYCNNTENYKEDKTLESENVKYLDEIQNSVFKKHVTRLENVRILNDKNYCYPCFNKFGDPYWFFPIIQRDTGKESIQYPNKEAVLPSAVRYLDSLLFYGTKKKSVCNNLFPLDDHLIENTYFQLSKKLEKSKTDLNRRDYLTYTKSSFYKKLKFILHRYYKETLKLLHYIYVYNEARKLTTLEDILIDIKIDLFLDGKKVIPKHKFLHDFKTLQQLGIFIEKNDKFLFPKEIGDNLFSKPNKTTSDLIIDNSLAITCYYQNISIEDIYFLKAFCDLSFNDYTIEGMPSTALSSFAWFCSVNDSVLKRKLYETSMDYYNSTIESQINSYFQSVKYFYRSHSITLYTPSKEKYEEVKFHYSKDEQINHHEDIHFIPKKNTIILENKSAFEEFQNFLQKYHINLI